METPLSPALSALPVERTGRGRRRALHIALLLAALTVLALATPDPVRAHQPVVVDQETIEVTEPEISKAYYGVLSGTPHYYRIESAVAFDLYVGILVPDDGSPQKDVRAEIFRDTERLATIGGVDAAWSRFYEPFGENSYFEGGEFRLRAPPGVYTVSVSSVENTSAYSLAIGEIESFDLAAIVRTFLVMPTLEQELFGLSSFDFARSRFGLLSLGLIVAAAFAVALLYRTLLRRHLSQLSGGRGGVGSLVLRLITALLSFSLVFSGTWNPPLLFLSAFLLLDVVLGARAAERR